MQVALGEANFSLAVSLCYYRADGRIADQTQPLRFKHRRRCMAQAVR